jgi:uncharacterized delta-60 repeat protein
MTRRTRGVGFIGAMALAFGLVAVAAGAGGDLDPSFGDRGLVATATAPGAGGDFQNGLAVRSDRSIVVAGSSDMGAAGEQFRVSQYTKRGDLDASFGSGGTVITSVSSQGFAHIWEVALEPGGKIVVAGEASMGAGAGGSNFALARYNRDGSLDTSFGENGIVVTAVAQGDFRDNANAVALQADGKIVAAGGVRVSCPQQACNDFVVVRYTYDGSLDASFGGGDGIVTTAVAPGTRTDGVTGVAIQPGGKIVAGGQANMGAGQGGLNFAFARYNSDGSLDVSFGGDGIVTTAVAPGDGFDTAWEFALQADGKIVGAGNAVGLDRAYAALARYNTDGSLDLSFGVNGIATAKVGPADDDVWTVAIDAVGRIVIGGDTGEFPALDSAVARFSPNGTLDPSFGTGGVVVTPAAPDGGYDAFYEVVLDKTGKIVASGECDQPETGTDVCVARYQTAPDD